MSEDEMDRMDWTVCDHPGCVEILEKIGYDPNHHLGNMKKDGTIPHYCAAHCPDCQE